MPTLREKYGLAPEDDVSGAAQPTSLRAKYGIPEEAEGPKTWAELGTNALKPGVPETKVQSLNTGSADFPFLTDAAEAIGAQFTPQGQGENLAFEPTSGLQGARDTMTSLIGLGESPKVAAERETDAAFAQNNAGQSRPFEWTDPRLVEGTVGAVGRIAAASMTGGVAPLVIGGVEAANKALNIAQNEPGGFTERPLGSAARVGLAGAIPGASSKIAGAVVPLAAKAFASPLAQFAAGTGAGLGTDLALTEAQKGVEYLGSAEDPTAGGFGQALIPNKADIATLIPGAVAGGIGAARAQGRLRSAAEPAPKVSTTPPETEVTPSVIPAREAEGQTQGPIAPEPPAPSPEVIGQQRPVIQKSGASSASGGGSAPGSGDYPGGFNKRLFGMEENPELQKVYEAQAERIGPPPPGSTLAGVREAANEIPAFDMDRLSKIKTMDDVRGFSQAETQAISDQTAHFAEKRLSGELSPDDQAKFDQVSRVAKLARGVRGSDLAVLNQNTVARYVEHGNYKTAALKVLDDMDPSGKAPASAIKAIREMPDDPLAMARTVFLESRRYHGFMQNLITGNLLSNVFGTAPVNMSSNIMNLMAETAGRQSKEYVPAVAGAVRGSKQAAKRTGFAFKEGFPMEALADPSIAAGSPGFALGGRANPFNWGGRAAFAGDEFIKGVAEQSHFDVMAKAKALETHGKNVEARTALEAQLKAKPTPDMVKEAREFAKSVSYQMEPDEASSALGQFINWAPIGKGTRMEIKPVRMAVPFFKTVLNVAKANVKLSPLGAAGAVYKGARGKITPGQAVAQTAMGLIPMAIGLKLAQEGAITGPIPQDPAEREAFFESGQKPWTIKVGNKRIPIAWAGPFALSLGLGAALKEAERQKDQGKINDDFATIAAATGGNAFKLFMEGSPLVTLNSVLGAVTDPSEQNIKKLGKDIGSSLVPLVSLQGFLNRQDIPGLSGIRDPYVRDASGETAVEDVLNNIVSRTLLSRNLPRRLTGFGQEIQRPGQMTTNEPDPVYAELYRLGSYPSGPSKELPKAPGAVKAEKMSPDEYREVLKSGSPAYDILRQQLASPTWEKLPDDQKRLIIEQVFKKGLAPLREATRKQIGARHIVGAVNR